MDLDDFFGPNPIVTNLHAKSRWEAIDELIQHLVVSKKIDRGQQEAITEAIKKRESSMSTGIGFGIGLPHASTDSISSAVVAVGCSQKGIQFDSIDGKLVDLVVLFLIP